jgi:hypothetical protein
VIKKLWPLAFVLTGCATTGPTGGTRFDVPIVTQVDRLGVTPVQARAALVIAPEEERFKSYAPIPLGAWDYQWGRNLPSAARSAFSQVFYSAHVTPAPDGTSDYEVRLSFDRAKTSAHVGFSRMSSSLGLVAQLFAGRELLWERSFDAKDETSGNKDGFAVLGAQLARLAREAALAVHETVSVRPQPAPQAARPAAPVAAAPPAAAPPAPVVRSDVDELPSQRARRAGHAVVIGIERYREKLPKADFAAADAKLVAEYAKRVLGYPEENVAVLTDERAARGDFEKYFERWLPNRVEAGDEVLVFFSGHGAPNPKTGDAFLVPYEGDPTYIDETGYPVKRLYQQLAKLPAKRVVVALDSCFSGAGGRSVIAKGARPLVSSRAVDVPAKVTLIAASAGDQISNSYDEKGHGLFTYFFLKGLKEKGELRGAFDYAAPAVTKAARRDFNADQTPQWTEGR